MRERPILFRGEMVRAILAGQKTQTRRIVKPPPVLHEFLPGDTRFAFVPPQTQNGYLAVGCHVIDKNNTSYIKLPYGGPGDLLWVRETWGYGRNRSAFSQPHVVYRADAGEPRVASDFWKPSIHMRREHCRLVLEITGVRVERLQDISREDAIAEGIQVLPLQSADDPSAWWQSAPGVNQERTPQASFQALWRSIHGADSWDANPWLWVIGFRPFPQTPAAVPTEHAGGYREGAADAGKDGI